jgi:hypothetical protein
MNAASLAAPPPIERGGDRLIWILGLWATAALLVAIEYLHLQQVYADLRHSLRYGGEIIQPSGRWRFWGIVIPLLLVTTALILQRRSSSGSWRALSAIGLVVMVPVWLVGWAMTEMSGPYGFDSVRLADGRRFILAQEPVMTDSVYGLYEPIGPLGLYWRDAGFLDYSEDGRFTSNAGLVLSPDQQWLLVTRGGVWTDCFRVSPFRPVECATGNAPAWNDPHYERDMLLRSARIASLTGLAPPGDGPDP